MKISKNSKTITISKKELSNILSEYFSSKDIKGEIVNITPNMPLKGGNYYDPPFPVFESINIDLEE